MLENVISQLEKDIVKSEMDGGKYDAAARYGPRMKTTEREPTGADYDDAAANGPNAVPSIRDNEYVQHGTLWGAQYMSGTCNVCFFSIRSIIPDTWRYRNIDFRRATYRILFIHIIILYCVL